MMKLLTHSEQDTLRFAGVLAGMLLTAVIQSASASVGILQALAMTGAVEFDMAFPILMGIGIGAAVPVMLSALGASVNGKRTAFVYLVIDVLGAIICGAIGCSMAKKLKGPNGDYPTGKAKVGAILSKVGLIIGIVTTVIAIIWCIIIVVGIVAGAGYALKN